MKKTNQQGRRLFATLLALAMLLSVVPMNVAVVGATANAEDYIEIRTIEELYNISDDLTANYILMNDIDLTEATAEGGDWNPDGNGWMPIGSGIGSFSGNFDGNGKEIIGMQINRSSAGLFESISGTIDHLTMTDVNVSGSTNVGAFAATTTGATFTNCKVNGTLNGSAGDKASSISTGGFIGSGTDTVFVSCVNNATVSGGTYTGGFAGSLSGASTVEKCYNAGVIESNYSNGHTYSYTDTPGFPGRRYHGNYAGGIVASTSNSVTIVNCYNSGAVTVTTKSDTIVNGSYYYYYTGSAGGITSGSASISNCYNVGTVNGKSAAYAIGSGTISESYFLSESGTATTGATSLTAAQMKLKSMYKGFDFDTVWAIDSSAEYPYPTLKSIYTLRPDECTHNYTAAVTAPTCTTRGYTTYSCPTCGDSYTDDYVSATGHDYSSAVTAPTCTEQGYTTYTCSDCGDSYIDSYTSAKGHTPGESATCVRNQICTDCGEILEKATGHNYTSQVYAPTCTLQGYTAYFCGNCGDEYIDSYTRPYGHSYNNVVTAPTCTEKGYTTHTCSTCGDSYVDSYVNALGHATSGNATCTEDSICSTCGETVEEKFGHNYVSVVTKPTCTEKGYTTHTCSSCGDSYIDSYVNALGHTTSGNATCTEDLVCSTCGETVEEKFGHDYVSVVTAPTCTEKGYTTHTCFTCGDSYIDTYVKALGHTTSGNATCTEDLVCSTCGETVEEKFGHDYASVVTAPTCTEKGYTTHTCSSCGDEYVDTYITSSGHTEGEWSVVTEAQAGVEGLEEKCCTVCGEQLETRPIDALPSIKLGDVNLDGTVDKKDYAALKRYCFGTMELDATAILASDVNQDGTVDKKDYAALKRACFGTMTISPEYI